MTAMNIGNSAYHPAAPTVFISSTVGEFRDLRSALYYTLREKGCKVYLSEAAEFDVRGDRSACDECFRNITLSDYYILLIGNKRGSLFENGVSVTRQEYRVARDTFLSTHNRPKLLMFIRESTESALGSDNGKQAEIGIEDHLHLASFVDEVQNPEMEGVPSYLKRFRDFEDVIRSLDSQLNLGKNLNDTLLRRALLTELTENLTHITKRDRNTISPRHWYMKSLRQELQIKTQDFLSDISLTREQWSSLASAILGRTRGDELSTKNIREALDVGLFLIFNPANGTVEESKIHKELQQLKNDIDLLRRLDMPPGETDWDNRLLGIIENRPASSSELIFSGLVLSYALAHHDRVQNVFDGHVTLCRSLLGFQDEIHIHERSPVSIFGEQEAQRLSAEHVSASEILRLIENDVLPLGTRQI